MPVKDPGKGQIDSQPDGICLDSAGNLYVYHYGMKQVQVIDPNGKIVAGYDGGNLRASNVAFGGPTMDQLFISGALTAGPTGGLFRLDLGVGGLLIPPPRR